MTSRLVLVRSVGDVGSAVSLVLYRAGYAVVMHDGPAPTVTRRRMAFADAVFDGTARLEGVTARRAGDARTLREILDSRTEIPVVTWDFGELRTLLCPAVLVDARMRKRAIPDVQRGLAPLTIGLGPNFVAGETTDLVIETSWGEHLGETIREGEALPLADEPHAVGGVGRARFVYTPASGVFHTRLEIGAQVARGQEIARINNTALCAPLSGIIRGLTRDSVPVSIGTKVIEVDPRGSAAVISGLGERPRRIAEGVVRVVREFLSSQPSRRRAR